MCVYVSQAFENCLKAIEARLKKKSICSHAHQIPLYDFKWGDSSLNSWFESFVLKYQNSF